MKNLVLTMRVWMLAGVMAVMAACGGGGGGGGGTVGTAPVISGLVITPGAAYVSATPLVFNTRFDFTDADGNLSFVTLKILNGSGATVDFETLPLQGIAGITAGTILGEMLAVAVQPDTYTAQIYVTDGTGQQSNTLVGTARISAFPWTSKLGGPTPRDYAASAVLNGKVYVMGGQRTDSGVTPGPVTDVVEVYDPATNTWAAATSLPTARMGLSAVAMNGRIYAIGGSADGFGTQAVGTVEEFDPTTNLWTTRNPMPTPRYFAAAAALGGEILVAGGNVASNGLSTVEAFNPLTNQWRNRSAMPTARAQLAMAESGGRLYAVGGYGGLISQWVGTVEEYNPLTDTWVARASMPTPRAHLALAQLGGKLLAAGGENVLRGLDLLESYDPLANLWVSKTPSLNAFTRATAGVLNGKVYVFGNGLSLEYDPTNEIR